MGKSAAKVQAVQVRVRNQSSDEGGDWQIRPLYSFCLLTPFCLLTSISSYIRSVLFLLPCSDPHLPEIASRLGSFSAQTFASPKLRRML